MKSLFFILFLSILLIPSIQAVSMNATNITSVGLNTTFYINRITSFSVLTVHGSYINFSNLVYTHPLSSEGNITIQKLNISDSNKRFTISSLPYFTSSSTSSLKKIASNLSQAINATDSYGIGGYSCTSVTSMTFTNPSRSKSYNVLNQPNYACSNSQITVDIYNQEPTNSSCTLLGQFCNEIAITVESGGPGGSNPVSGTTVSTTIPSGTTIVSGSNETLKIIPYIKELTQDIKEKLSENKGKNPTAITLIISVITIVILVLTFAAIRMGGGKK